MSDDWKGVNLLRNVALISGYGVLILVMVLMMMDVKGWFVYFIVFMGFYMLGFTAIWQYDKSRTIEKHSGALELVGPMDQDFNKEEDCEFPIESIDEFPDIPKNVQESIIKFVISVRDKYNLIMDERLEQKLQRVDKSKALTEEEREIWVIAEELATADRSMFNKQLVIDEKIEGDEEDAKGK